MDEAEVNKLFLSTNNYPQPFLLKSLRQSDFLSILSSYLLPQKMASRGLLEAQIDKKKWEDEKHLELCHHYGYDFIELHHITHDETEKEYPYFCKLCTARIPDIQVLQNHLESKKHNSQMEWKQTSASSDDIVQQMYDAIQHMTYENRVKLLTRLYETNSEEYKMVIKTSEAEAWLTTATHQSKDIAV